MSLYSGERFLRRTVSQGLSLEGKGVFLGGLITGILRWGCNILGALPKLNWYSEAQGEN